MMPESAPGERQLTFLTKSVNPWQHFVVLKEEGAYRVFNANIGHSYGVG